MADIAERVGRVRKGRRTGGYTVVQNDLINNQQLSIEARGLMIYLLSRPDDWELRLTDVRRFLGCDGKPCGRDKGYKIVAELRRHRYLVMCENIIGQHFAGVTYYIFDEPVRDIDEVQRKHRAGEDALDAELGSPLPEKPEAEQIPLPDFPHPEKPEAIVIKDNIQTTEIPLTPTQRKTRTRKGSGGLAPSAPTQPSTIADPWSKAWTEHRIRTLMRGREQSPGKPSAFIAARIAKGGEAGERERLAHQARSCWPTVKAMDEAASQDARGWRVPADLLGIDLDPVYHSVSVHSAEFEQWQAEHRRRGWPEFPIPSRADHVWLPVAGVAALDLPNCDARASA